MEETNRKYPQHPHSHTLEWADVGTSKGVRRILDFKKR
jgi:hypothetical protein